MSKVFYKVRKHTEAGRAIDKFFKDEQAYNKSMRKAVKKLGGDPEHIYYYNNGQLAGIFFEEKPDGWRKTKIYECSYLPYAKNKKAWDELPKPQSFSGSELSALLLNKVPCSFSGMRMRTGCGLITVNDIHYVSHVEEKGIKPKLKGMRKIKESTFIKETKENT